MRCRVHATNGEKLGYALSLKTELDVKHMKIDSTKAGGNYFYLSDTRKFRSHHKNDIGGYLVLLLPRVRKRISSIFQC